MNFKTKAEELIKEILSSSERVQLRGDLRLFVWNFASALKQAHKAGYSARKKETNSGRFMYQSGFKDGKLEGAKHTISLVEEQMDDDHIVRNWNYQECICDESKTASCKAFVADSANAYVKSLEKDL